MSDFETEITAALRQAILKKIGEAGWLDVGYGAVKVPPETLRRVYATVDMDRVAVLLKDRIEERIADAMYNSLATEVATDTKQILCNKELREDLRAILRQHMRAALAGVTR